MFVSRINTTVARKLKIVLFKIYTIFSINIDMVGFSVLLHLYINRNISEIVSNKINLYMTLLVEGYNIGIIHEVKLVPEAQPRDTNGRVVLSLLSTLGRKHILMARSLAEGPNF